MMTIMGGIAEFERGLIRQRCEEGIAGQGQGCHLRPQAEIGYRNDPRRC
jgi:DNA invertase Pin-like site-specific DNA recombinase